MSNYNWNEITRNDVLKAISQYDKERPDHPAARTTFLLFNDKKYPAKHIRGMAYKVHFGEEISKEEYAGGRETVRFFERLGFDMQYKRTQMRASSYSKNKVESKKEKKVADNNIKVQSKETKQPQKKETKNTQKIDKIKIPVKGVIEQKNALQLHLNKICEGDVVCEKTYEWMKTPEKIVGEYKSVCNALTAYRGDKDFAKKNVSLRCDFVCESRKLIIEYDERQHFSEARRISLLSYYDVDLDYDRELWIKACEDIRAKDNQPPNRDETRAYYDSARDIEAAKHGYRLIRIMHGVYDFNKPEAESYLKQLIESGEEKNQGISQSVQNSQNHDVENRPPVKIGLYLQTYNVCDKASFQKAMAKVRKSDIDILVFPEFAYLPFEEKMKKADFLKAGDVEKIYRYGFELSKEIGKAIVFCNENRSGIIMSIYINAFAEDGETVGKEYIKHTMTDYSACEIANYREYSKTAFEPILYKGYRIGLTICYDCNHSMFSRKYGLDGVDIILNCTGGDVRYDKWSKYNRARSIENHCFSFVTMGGPGGSNTHNYVYGFTPEGKEMHPTLLDGSTPDRKNMSGEIYVYDTSEYDGCTEVDPSIDQTETVNKKQDMEIPVNDVEGLIGNSEKVDDNIRVISHKGNNVILCIVDGEDIMKPEKVLNLLYDKRLKTIKKKKYIIINRWDDLDLDFYRTKLSVILKVRSMENYCAVILSSPQITKCYQCGHNRTAQIVKSENGSFGIDLSRTGGPETIWKNKMGMKAVWRDNIEWLIDSLSEK